MASTFLLKNNWELNRAVSAYYNGNNDNTKHTPKGDALRELQALFDKYKDPSSDIILIDGTLSYLSDLGIDPEDCLSLTLAYLLSSPQTGEFHRKEFVAAWNNAGVSTLSGMKEHIQSTHVQLTSSASDFVKLYNYVFGFVKGPDRQVKTMDYEDAISYWRLLFAQCAFLSNCTERLEQWYMFIEQTKRGISKDLWEMFFKFVTTVLSEDPVNLSSYDEMSAWHSMIDEYVEWLQENDHLQA